MLDEWLVYTLRPLRTALLPGVGIAGGTGGALYERIGAVAERQGWTPVDGRGDATGAPFFEALIVIKALGDAAVEPVIVRACEAVLPGGLIIELAHPPSVRPWQVLRWLRRTRVMRSAAELRARAWLGLGLYAVEQWAPVDLPRLLVTCGRWRAIPGP